VAEIIEAVGDTERDRNGVTITPARLNFGLIDVEGVGSGKVYEQVLKITASPGIYLWGALFSEDMEPSEHSDFR